MSPFLARAVNVCPAVLEEYSILRLHMVLGQRQEVPYVSGVETVCGIDSISRSWASRERLV